MGIVSSKSSGADVGAAGCQWTSTHLAVTVQFVRQESESAAASPSAETHAASDARAFVEQADVQAPRVTTAAPDSRTQPEIGTLRATLIGSNLVSFADGVPQARAEVIVRALVLAQLAATKSAGKPKTMLDVRMWSDAYFNVLANIGFSPLEHGTRTRVLRGRRFDATEAMADIALPTLTASTAATQAVTRSLQALRNAPKDSPLIKLFNRESLSATAARFLLTVVYQESDGPRLLSVAFGLYTKSRLRNLLTAQLRGGAASLSGAWRRFAVDTQVLEAVKDAIDARLDPLASQVAQYVHPLPEE
jgi:hypothetical protein